MKNLWKTKNLENIGIIFAGNKKTKQFSRLLGICRIYDKNCYGSGEGFGLNPETKEVISQLPDKEKIKRIAFHTSCFLGVMDIFMETFQKSENYFTKN